MYAYICMCIYLYMYMSAYIYIYIYMPVRTCAAKEREGEGIGTRGSWACAYSSRGYKTIKKEEVLQLLTSAVGAAYRVDINNAQHTFIVEVNPVRLSFLIYFFLYLFIFYYYLCLFVIFVVCLVLSLSVF